MWPLTKATFKPFRIKLHLMHDYYNGNSSAVILAVFGMTCPTVCLFCDGCAFICANYVLTNYLPFTYLLLPIYI